MRRGMVVALVLASAWVAALPAAALGKRAPSRLRSFASCAQLVDYAQRHFAQTHGVPEQVMPGVVEPTIPVGAPGMPPAPEVSAGKDASPSYSTTNVQEEGVDEPDVVKTDGATIFTVVGRTLYAVATSGPGAPRIAGLGQGQSIYSVRFIGDVGYVVTFRQVDPLYTIGLADPTKPRVLGELELLGYSAYLHPIGGDLLLGVGQDATPEGRTKGVQVSLFGVGDPAHPRLLAQHALGTSSSSQVEYDSHAFLYWAPSKLVVLPVQVFDNGASAGPGFTGALALRVDRSGIAEVGRVAHDPVNGYPPPVTRSLVIGGSLWTLSDGGVMASALVGLGRLGWVASPS